jgi:uncharacterized membrane protein YoaK (UPF0700 family)
LTLVPFLHCFIFFVAQVTGSFVIAGGQIVELDKTMLVPVLAIPTFFLMGLNTTLLLAWSRRTGWTALTATLAVELALVVAFFAVGTIGGHRSFPRMLRLRLPQAFLASRRWACKAHWYAC